MKRVNQFLDYMWMHPDALIRYHASDMILNVHSDALYLSAPKAHSRASGYFFPWQHPMRRQVNPTQWCHSRHMHYPQAGCSIPAAEAELGALILNAQEAKVFCLVLDELELGHPQPPTPIHIDNTTTVGIVNNTIKCQQS
jgi:hypothetical protein